MPIFPCKKDGKDGYKAGSDGKCYTGQGSEERAKNQLSAIKSSQGKNKDCRFNG